jgi:hypothetical protein
VNERLVHGVEDLAIDAALIRRDDATDAAHPCPSLWWLL